MEYGCIGEHLGHSFSAEIHAELGSYRYEIREIAPDDLGEFLTKRDFSGINVTIPYKAAVIPYLSEIDESAARIGAVNTIVNRDGRLFGYNTDFYGMRALIERLGLDLQGKKVAVLGTGGTSRTACAVAEALGSRAILRVGRQAREGGIDYEALYRDHADAEILINTTPCGMYPDLTTVAVELDRLPKIIGVVDAVYNPLRPQLVLDAENKGIPASGGLFMLVAQALRASEIFLDITYPDGVLERVYNKICNQKKNIVLIGMPGSGKSTVGKLLSEMLGRGLIDTDTVIVERAGKSIPEIFSEDGETAFRNLESRVIADLSARNGLILSTGGGAILRDANVEALKRNGVLYFLDRPLEALLPTDDRPLASSRADIARRYEERYDRYCGAADRKISVRGDAASARDEIGKDFETT